MELDDLCAALAKSVGATKGRALSNDAVMVDGKIAAFISKDRLVVKLPARRIEELLVAGEARRMTMGTRVMKEWVSVPASSNGRWIALAEESARYVLATAVTSERSRKARRR
jgi:hypothetical protein